MEPTTTRKRILLVDDDEDFLFQHRVQLENAGFDVVTATARQEAEQVRERPDLAILDLMMEHHDDGFVLSHHLKRRFPDLPVILVTAVTAETGLGFNPSSPEERAWVGADAVLAKPIRFEQLRREIERLVQKRA